MNRETSFFLSSMFGKVEDVDAGETSDCLGKFLRIRVNMDITRPLRRILRVRLNIEVEICTTMPLLNEKLPDFCFACGRIGHLYRDCMEMNQDKSSEGNVQSFSYGPWLRASSRGGGEKKNKSNKLGEKGEANSKDIESSSKSMDQNPNDVRLRSQVANKCKLSTNGPFEKEGRVQYEKLMAESRSITPLIEKKSSLSTCATNVGLKEKESNLKSPINLMDTGKDMLGPPTFPRLKKVDNIMLSQRSSPNTRTPVINLSLLKNSAYSSSKKWKLRARKVKRDVDTSTSQNGSTKRNMEAMEIDGVETKKIKLSNKSIVGSNEEATQVDITILQKEHAFNSNSSESPFMSETTTAVEI